MTLVFCIPATRDRELSAALASLGGQQVEVFNDLDSKGANFARNRAFEAAVQRGATTIRFLDDDDECIGDEVEDLARFVRFPVKMLNDVVHPCREALRQLIAGWWPCGFQARTEALLALAEKNGHLFDEARPCMQGSWFWLDVMKAFPEAEHHAVVGGPPRYRWTGGHGVSLHSDRAEQDRLYRIASRQFVREQRGTL